MNRELIVSSHPAVLNGFIDMFREEVFEKELSAGQEQDTSGHDVQKSEPEQMKTDRSEPKPGEQGKEEQAETEQTQAGQPEQAIRFVVPEQEEPEVTLTVAECGKFHNLGEFYENIPTVEEVIAIWKQIPPGRMNGISAIGVNIHVPGTESFEDVEIDVLYGKRIDLDILEYIPEIKGNAQAMEVIAELVAKLPEMEIDGNMSEEMKVKVWEKRMLDMTPAEQLAVEIDRFTYDYDVYSYRDNVQSMTENVTEIFEMTGQRDIVHMAEWFAEVIVEDADPEDTKRAKELLDKLVEYRPLAKIEKMEEQNYNMIDNVFNNGCEKFHKEVSAIPIALIILTA